MNITSLGGTETVTGSKYFVESGNTKILIDCGLYQGYKWLHNHEPLQLDIQSLDAIVFASIPIFMLRSLVSIKHYGFSTVRQPFF